MDGSPLAGLPKNKVWDYKKVWDYGREDVCIWGEGWQRREGKGEAQYKQKTSDRCGTRPDSNI